VMRPLADRQLAWQRLSEILETDDFTQIGHVITLEQVIDSARELLDGKIQGRIIVKF
jgi:acrylyl-CoA reductase (NADPH)